MPLMMQLEFSAITLLGLLGSLILGLVYSSVLYASSGTLGRRLHKILFAFRALLVTAITFLLFAPMIKTIRRTVEKPLIILAQDNSASIGVSEAKDFDSAGYSRSFRNLEKVLQKDYDVRAFSFGNRADSGLSFDFKEKLTNISSVFDMVRDRFSNRNIGAVVLASDGIYNEGGNPQYGSQPLKAPIYSIALGDTIPKKDVLISNVLSNNIAYLGNRFQIEVTLEAYQSRNHQVTLMVRDRDRLVYAGKIPVGTNEFRRQVPVTLEAKAKGVQKYTVSVSGVPGELSRQNNAKTIYVEVVDGRQNILILGNSPHPDIAAIKASIERNDNYHVEVQLADAVNPEEINKANLVILHQVPAANQSHQELLRQIAGKPVLFILGAQTNPTLFSSAQPAIVISAGGPTQEVMASVRSGFYGFTLSAAASERLGNFAPLLAPFGNYSLKGPASVLLSQQIGRVTTDAPLLAFSMENNRKVGVLAGEGIWRWRLEEFQETGSHTVVEELIGKTIQYLSSKDDKRKFRVYTSKHTFDENERVVLNAELYNDAYELINSPDIPLNIKSNAGRRYSYAFSRTGNGYILDAGILPAGEYSYDANIRLGNKRYTSEGRFVIVQQQAEFRHTTANHQLLNSMALQSGGQMISPRQLDELPRIIRANEDIRSITYEDRNYVEIIDKKWAFILILALLAVEWVTRKRHGEI